jgi:hypothetical protein
MRKLILQLSGIFIFTFGIIALYSFSELQIEIYGIEIKKAEIKEAIIDTGDKNNLTEENPKKDNNTFQSDKIASKLDSSKQKILIIGDSMTEGIMRAMNDYCAFNNHKLYSVIWSSSSIQGWSKSSRLKSYVSNFKPTYIIVVLGSNELLVPNSTRREESVRSILKQAEGVDLVWVGPPNWREDAGINKQLTEILGQDRFFLSKDLKFDRQRDGCHPTMKSGKMWTDEIAKWIMEKAKHRILLNRPEAAADVKPDVVYFNNN